MSDDHDWKQAAIERDLRALEALGFERVDTDEDNLRTDLQSASWILESFAELLSDAPNPKIKDLGERAMKHVLSWRTRYGLSTFREHAASLGVKLPAVRA